MEEPDAFWTMENLPKTIFYFGIWLHGLVAIRLMFWKTIVSNYLKLFKHLL